MATVAALYPVQVNDLPDINDISENTAADERCLAELKEVILKHGRSERFGVSLLHKHFQLGEGELLIEFCDREARTLLSKPVQKSTLENVKIIKTLWRFDQGAEQDCTPYCPSKPNGEHYGYKDHG